MNPGETYIVSVPAGGPDRQVIMFECERVRGAWAYGSDGDHERSLFLPLARICSCEHDAEPPTSGFNSKCPVHGGAS